MEQHQIDAIIINQVENKVRELSTWKRVQWQGGRLYYETTLISNEIANYDTDLKILFLEHLLQSNFILQDNWPSAAPDITQDFKNWVSKKIATLKIERFQELKSQKANSLQGESKDPETVEIPSKKSQNELIIVNSSKQFELMEENKEVFVTYAWDSEQHQKFVYDFVNDLRAKGYHAHMDTYKSQQESSIDFIKMMHQAMTDYQKVIIVLSKKYKEKAESFAGGVGTEYGLIIKDIQENFNKYVLVSADGHDKDVTPMAFKHREIIDISRPYKADMMNKLYGKLSNQATMEFHPVAVNKPEINIVRPAANGTGLLLFSNLNVKSGGAQLFESQYRSIEYEVQAIVKNLSSYSLKGIVIEIEMPSTLCNGYGIGSKNYRNDENYREEGGRSFFTFNIARVLPNQTVTTSWISIELTYNNIDELIGRNIVVRVFTDEETPEREFEIQSILVDSDGKNLDLRSFRTKYDRYRQT